MQPRHRQLIAWKPDTAFVDRLLRRNALVAGLALYDTSIATLISRTSRVGHLTRRGLRGTGPKAF